MSDYPFSLIKRKDRPFYYVRFKDSKTNKVILTKSTETSSKKEALKIAMEWQVKGIPIKENINDNVNKKNVISQSTIDLISTIKTSNINDLSPTEKEKIIEILINENFIKSAVISNTVQDVNFIEWLLKFWNWNESEYIKERLKRQQRITKNYVDSCFRNAQNYWKPYFKNKLLGEITHNDLKNFLEYLDTCNISNNTKNGIFKLGTTALRYAYNNGIIKEDVARLRSFLMYSNTSKQREILTKEIMQALLQTQWKHSQSKLAFFISVFSGMRSGEIRALRMQDLGNNCFYVSHSYNDIDGLKCTKNGEPRTVNFPFDNVIQKMLELGYQNPHNDKYIFWGMKENKPMDSKIWLDDFREALRDLNILPNGEEKKYCFHGQRHFFTTYMRDLGTTDRFLQQQTGHKTIAMLDHYSNHETRKGSQEISNNQRIMFNEIFNIGSTKEKTENNRIKMIDDFNIDLSAEQQSINKTNYYTNISNDDFIKQLPTPTEKEPIKALQQCGLINDDYQMTTSKGISFCIFFLCFYGYDFNIKDFSDKKIKDINGIIYEITSISAMIRKHKRKFLEKL